MTQPIRILVLEDHLAMRVAIVALLRDAGYEVDTTANPYEAMELLVAAEGCQHPLAAGRTFDLVLVDHDLNSPGLHLFDAEAIGEAPRGWSPAISGAQFIRQLIHLADPAASIPGSTRLGWAPPCIGISAAPYNNDLMMHAGAAAALAKGRFERELLPLIANVLTDNGYEPPFHV